MPFFVGDYLADTTHLNRSEHGAYLLLLMAMWRAGGKLPADHARLARLALCTPDEWAEIKGVILEFFTKANGVWTHKKLDKVSAKYAKTVNQRSDAGKASAEARALKKLNENKDNVSTRISTKTEQDHNNQNQNQNQKEVKDSSVEESLAVFSEFDFGELPPAKPKLQPPALVAVEAKPAKSDRGSRLPESWRPNADETNYAMGLGLSIERVDRIAVDFREYWVSKPGAAARKTNWTLTWQGWIRREIDRNGTGQTNGAGRPASAAGVARAAKVETMLRSAAKAAHG